MRIIISPAKKMKSDTDSLEVRNMPYFISKTEILLSEMQKLSDTQLQDIWKCNDSIAKLNIERLRYMDLYHNLTPSILVYEGIQYQYMAPAVFSYDGFEYLEEHLRILSGFYGVLRPFDGVTPYRLEMQAKLPIQNSPNLYNFWSDSIARHLAEETDFILNLASREYSKAVTAHLPENVRFLNCVFGEIKDGKIVEKGTLCKMARGQMVRWLADNKITDAEDFKCFSDLGYKFSTEYSTVNNYFFIKGEN